MNEYDSDKMADVLARLRRPDAAPSGPRTPTSSCSTRARCARRRRSACSTTWAACARSRRDSPDLIIGVGGCVASQEGAAIVRRAPVRRRRVRPADAAPAAAADRAAPRDRRAAGRHQLSRDREIRPPAAAARRRRVRVRVDHGRLQQVLHVLRRAVHARRGSLAAVRRRADRDRRPRRPGRAWKSRCSARTSTRIAAPMGGGPARSPISRRCSSTSPRFPGIERIRYTTSHPKEMTPRLDRRARRRSRKLVSHLHLPVQSGSDRVLAAMKRGYTALEYKSIVRRLRAARPDLSLTSDFIVGFPGETDADFAQTMKLVEDVGFDGAFSFAVQRAPGHAGRRAAPTRCPRDDPAGAARARCRRCSTRSTARTARRWSARASACSSPAAPRRDARELAARTDNNRVVNFAGDAALDRHAMSTSRSPRRCRIRCAASSSRPDARGR